MHDVVLSEIRLATLQLEVGAASVADAHRALLDLDHRLRLGQLEATIFTGRVTVGEVVQPHVRRAQALSVAITATPDRTVAARTIGPELAHGLNRALSVTCSNALHAGATEIAVRVFAGRAHGLVAEVSDNAGGFDLADAPLGRGLSSLRTHLGAGCVSRRPVPGGSIMRIDVPGDIRPHRDGLEQVG